MAREKVLIKGNYALGEAAVRAGCRFFAGYPITPQSELLEYMSHRLFEVGGNFRQTESEVAGINMIMWAAACGVRSMTGSSGPGFSLMQEGISYLASNRVPSVIVNVVRYACGIGNISAFQGDYLQMAKGGGHGDYHCVVLAPGDLQDAVDLMPVAFDISEKYRFPVIFAVDGSIGLNVEAVEFPEEIQNPDPARFDWALREKSGPERRYLIPSYYADTSSGRYRRYEEDLRAVTAEMKANEQRWECIMTDDAEVIMVAYGTMSRLCHEAVVRARRNGVKLGLIRLRTLWPFPVKAFAGLNPKAYLAVEMTIMPQMAEDVALTVRGRQPVYSFTSGVDYPSVDTIISACADAVDGKLEEV